MVVEDVIDSWWQILVALGLTMIVSLLFIVIMRWIAAPVIWFTILGVIGILGYVGLYLASVGDPVHRVVGLNSTGGCVCSGPPEGIYENGHLCDPDVFHQYCREPLTGSFFRQENAACRSASCHFQRIDSPKIVGYFHGVNVVGFFWLLFFVSAFNEMVLASAFSTWYWTFHKSDVPFFNVTISMGRTIRYHLGTLAFGSLIITICRIIRCILEYIDHKLKKFDNEVTRGILCCCKCFFWCLEKFLKFLNRNAYIMCAIHGKNFCSSARDAFNLLMRNFLRVIALDKVTDFLFFMAKVLIAAGMGVATHYFIKSPHSNMDLNYSFVPVIIVAIGSYLIASVFFSVYSMAVDTLFLCFLEDTERNDGSPEKPYFMSKQLMRILGKKNEVPRHRYR
uniref:Choline transporter-like protein n=1 Tax=Phlebotomus papatasi TaxID=29031 RepID=A0A1B0DG12_PHLPP